MWQQLKIHYKSYKGHVYSEDCCRKPAGWTLFAEAGWQADRVRWSFIGKPLFEKKTAQPPSNRPNNSIWSSSRAFRYHLPCKLIVQLAENRKHLREAGIRPASTQYAWRTPIMLMMLAPLASITSIIGACFSMFWAKTSLRASF